MTTSTSRSAPEENSAPQQKVFDSLGEIVCLLANGLRPPRRMSVAEASEEYRFVNSPGSYVGWWKNSTVPYMVKPMETLNSRSQSALIFVGPAQSAKTDALIVNWITYSVIVDPMDMIVYSPTFSAARDFSIRRVDRLQKHTKAVGKMMSRSRDTDNKFDKHYTNGMMLSLSWPSSTELAGKPIGRTALTDYDRIEEDIDGEGSAFDLATKRTTTFGSFAMTVCESSPSRPLQESDERWIKTGAHEAPPTTGILALYNRGDRHLWVWPCPHCDTYFEGKFSYLEYDKLGSHLDRSATVKMKCPCCSELIAPQQKRGMNARGVWIREGESVVDGVVVGEGLRSDIASFWMNGTAAAFVTWQKLVQTFLQTSDELAKTGSHDALKKFYNTDLAEIYMPTGLGEARVPEVLKSNASNNEPEIVPEDVRCLIATVDVGARCFDVQISGIRPGAPYDAVVIHRFKLEKSNRLDIDGDRLYLKPATYLEDWDLITEEVMNKTYPLAGDPTRHMMVKYTICDSGGQAGATEKAYNFYRKLRSQNEHGRFHLLKGETRPNAPRCRVDFPDSNRKDKFAVARGDVPVLFFNSNLLKDELSARLECMIPGTGQYVIPKDFPNSYFVEMCNEVREAKGWVHTRGRNESWDLGYYTLGLCASSLLPIMKVDWANPPDWLKPWDRNTLVFQKAQGKIFDKVAETGYDFAQLGKQLA